MKKILVVLMALVLCVVAFAACDNGKQPEVTYDAASAATFVFNLYKDATTKTEDFEVTATVQVNGVAYDVEWTATEGATVTKKDDTTYTVDIDEKSATGYEFTLTATVKAADGTTAQKAIKFNVPKYEVISFEQYMAAAEGDSVTIQGIVVAINAKSVGNSRNHLFLADANVVGGYYSYQMDADPVEAGVKVGMTVSISGPVAPYSGMQEIKGGTFKIIDQTIKEYAPVDITEAFSTGASLKNYVGLPVTIKGVEIAGQELGGTSEYLKFKLGDKTSYIRTYVTDFPTTLKIVVGEDGTTSSPDKTTIDEAHAAKYGYKANVTGILVLYNSNPYLIPMSTDCFEYLEKVEKTNEQKIAEELEALTIPTFISKDTTLELPLAGTNYADVKYAWTVDKEGYTVDAEGKIALTVSSTPVELKFTVTATCGDKTATKDITVKVALAKMSIAEALQLDDGAEVILVGVVTEIKTAWSDQYNNISVTLKDATGELYLYRLGTNVQVGDVITVTGKMGSYKGSKQLAQGSTAEIMKISTSAEATAAEDGTEVVLKGKVTEINTAWSEQYKNITVTITDAAGTFYLYRLGTNVAVGDEVIVIGKVGSYKGSKQLAQGGTAIILAAAAGGEEGGEEGGNTNPTMPAKPTGNALATFTFGENGEAAHVDGQDLGETTSYTEGNYKLDLTGMSKVYGPATDAKGNSCIKLGTSSKTATLSFTVAEGVNKVVIRIAAYKANATKVNVNGQVFDISENKSNDGSYYEIVVDTSTTKTITIATVEGACRAMIDSIAYYA